MRSWFFRIFALLSLFFITIFNIAMCWGDMDWAYKAISSNIPYFSLLILNIFQAISAIFLASDFLKRDKKLDTSEVFYVRPLSNAEYVLGKLWGNLRVFIFLNGVVMGISLFCTATSPHVAIDWSAYPIYFILISIPTLVFIIGLSAFLMSVLKNQAVTFILLLGYILLSIIYLENKYYSLFDYMTYFLPLAKSSIVGFTNTEMLLNHRGIYLFAGLAFIFVTITFFARLANTSRSKYGWLALSVIMVGISGWFAYKHVHTITGEDEMRRHYTELNNKYVHSPKMFIDRYDISVEQQPHSFRSEVKMQGIALSTASVFTFCLNPGLNIQEISGEAGQALEYERERQIVLVDFGKELSAGDTACITIKYSGRVDNAFCYLDIPAKLLQESYHVANTLRSDKQYCFQTPDYLMFTPETYWYPRPGTAYSSESPDWQQIYFSQFNLNVKPLPGLVPISQGEETENGDGSYSFIPEYPAQAISLVIGKYMRQRIETEGISYELRFIEGHDYYAAAFDSIRDTIPALIREYKENTERTYHLEYPFKRFSVVEAPAQFSVYTHTWSLAKENVQPEMVFVSEKLWTGWFEFENEIKRRKRWNQSITEEDAQMNVLRDALQQIPLFPQLYNFRYNIFSSEWPVANRIVEYYLQEEKNTPTRRNSPIVFEGGVTIDWNAGNGGLTNDEKANQLMEKQNLKDLLANDEYRELSSSVIRLKAKQLFAPAELTTDISAFRESVYALLNRNTFRNVRFEEVLDTLGALSRTDLRSRLTEWFQPTLLPFYSIEKPEIIRYSHRGKDVYVLKITINNLSDNDGIVNIITRLGDGQAQNDPRTNRNLWVGAHQSKQVVTFWDEAPRSVACNTIISDNIPFTVEQPVDNIRQENREPAEKEGDYPVAEFSSLPSEEVIVDNEDSLFFLSKEVVTGLLPKWLNNNTDTAFRYSDLPSWRRAPIQWTATTNPGFYGQNIRSAYVVKGGSGNHAATWKVPVPSAGNYEVYYHLFKDQNQNRRNRSGNNGAEYHFKIQYEGETEDAYLELQRAGNGWERLGAYYFGKDTVRITLTNETKERRVTADAVKIVKR
jgi:ABC-type transport system involved in multi-copper enzyme maturation permease subunit